MSGHPDTVQQAADWWATTGQRIAMWRRSRKLTQQNLAISTGLSRASIANLERGHQHINVLTLTRIAATLEVDPCDLLPCPRRAHWEEQDA